MKSAWILLPALLFSAGNAQAAIETWVSGTGTDSGTCPITAPCRTFAYAHNQTNANGTINVLSSGNFGPVTITKSISIVAQGVEAVINSAAAAAIRIDAAPTAIVSLRGLTIDMQGTLREGIFHFEGGALHVQDCVIRRTGLYGIRFYSQSGNKELYVVNSVLSDGKESGIFTMPLAGNVRVVIDRVRVENMAKDGIVLTSGFASFNATVRDSVISGNGGIGLGVADSTGETPKVHIMIDRVTSANNGIGVRAGGPATKIWMGNSTVTGNSTGLTASSGGVIESYGNNKVNGNVTDGAPTSTIATK